MPEQWEDTSHKLNKNGGLGKHINFGSPYLFYWVNDEIEIIEHKNN
jgi:hypothetical protein